MFCKRCFCIIFFLIILIGAISAVSSADLNQTAENLSDDGAIETPVEGGTEVQKSFADLNRDINGNDKSEIYLNHNYTFDLSTDVEFREGIDISRDVSIWGNGHTLNGNGMARAFKVSSGNVVFHDIVFINGRSDTEGGAIKGLGTAVNCRFINNTADYGGATSLTNCVNCSFEVNTARYAGGASTAASFTDCIFTGNSATDYAGAVYQGSNMMEYSIVNCTFVDNRANIGGAINQIFSDVAVVENCRFIRNSAVWQAGAIYNGEPKNCIFTENSADYGGAVMYGSAENCNFTKNHGKFGGVAYQSTCINCNFTENYADCGGAIYDGYNTRNCRFFGNYAYFGGAICGNGKTAVGCDFIYNYAQSGGALYQVAAEDCYFAYNEAAEYGGAMYGESAKRCFFRANNASSGNDAYNTEIIESSHDISHYSNVIYFDAFALRDGDGSKGNPYKYLYAERIVPGSIVYFAKGTYELDGTCMIDNVKIVGSSAKIISKPSNPYDFIIRENSYLYLTGISFANTKILNQGTLIVEYCSFTGYKMLDSDCETQYGSGLFNCSFGGAIVCDSPGNVRTKLSLRGSSFYEIYDSFNGGVIAAVNSDISIYNTEFRQYSATYKGGAIYCLYSKLDIYNVKFNPYTRSNDNSFIVDRYDTYTAYYGGSIYCENSQIKLERTNFVGSVAFSFGGCIAAFNSDIASRDDYFNDSMSITDGGGAIYSSQGKLTIVNSRMYNNSAEFGGALCNLNSVLDSYRTWYVFNSANRYGGVIYDIYGSITLRTNLFGDSNAQVGGSIYTRIPNVFNVYSNSFATSFAEKGSTIFFDGKRENIATNIFSNQSVDYSGLMIPLDSAGIGEFNTFLHDYSVFAEFTATLNGEEYSIISNPVYYQVSNGEIEYLHFPWSTYRVTDHLASITIHDLDDELSLRSVACHGEVRNVSAQINLTEGFSNPVLKFYLLKGTNIYLDNCYGYEANNLYTGSREDLFKGYEYELIATYTMDLSDEFAENNRTLVGNCSFDFGNPFLSINYDDLYEVGSFYPVSLVNASLFNPSIMPGLDEFTSYYNSNDLGLVSSVKDQKDGGNCWAFSGLATLETCLNKATGMTFDFSVENAKNLMAAYSVFGLKIETNYGGYESMLLSYLTSWLGPIDQSLEDYDDYSSISLQTNPMFHIQNIRFLPARLNSEDNDLYKLAIRDYGAVSVTFKWGDEYHAVSLVGWDDNYKGKDSIGNDANGAWIFKNSWGFDWGNGGFGYLSYNQKLSEQISPNMHAYTFIFSDVNPYTKIYQYDYAGVSDFYHYQDSIYFKNTFEAESDSLLSAFSTYFDRQSNCTVMVYVNDQFVLSQNGIYQAGYYTIPFNEFVQLNKGDKFSIVVNNHGPGYNCIPVCSADEINKKTFNQNVSFISLDGENWFDLYDYADYCHVACIKAFTQNVNLTGIKININEFSSVDTKNLNIKVTIDDFDRIAFLDYCLVKFVIDGNVHYAQIKDGKACLNINLEPGVHKLSAQYKDNVFESNTVQFSFTVNPDYGANSFNALHDLIDLASDRSTVNLVGDYFYDENFDNGEYGIYVGKSITIDGHGYCIDGLSNATAFFIAADNVVLNNIVFRNMISINGGSVYIAGRNVTLNNCTFINSSATQNGGGIYSLFDVTLNSCRFINNSASIGGGLYLINTGITHIRDSSFDSNFAGIRGAAIYLTGIGTALMSSTNFTNNHASYNGGAVLCANHYDNFTECLFFNNSANAGGAVFTNSHLNVFRDCIFSGNTAVTVAGAIVAYGPVDIFNSRFINNSATELSPYSYYLFTGSAGAIYSSESLNIRKSSFINNTATEEGGAIYTIKYLNVYESNFINNSAKLGGAVYNTASEVLKTDLVEGTLFVSQFSEPRFYDSTFIGNSAQYGGAVYEAYLVKNCTFRDNSAEASGGAVNTGESIIGSRFINNSAKYGGAVYRADLVDSCIFINNSASDTAGAVHMSRDTYEEKGGLIVNSQFINNYASYGGAVYSNTRGSYYDRLVNISLCNFTYNRAKTSGGAVYCDGKSLIEKSNFAENSAYAGGAVFLDNPGTHIIRDSFFTKNSASYGGAIHAYGNDNESSIATVNIHSSHFADNFANMSGGAIYSDCRCYISNSDFANDSATWGSTIYGRGYLDLRDSIVKSNVDAPVWFLYHYDENKAGYGDLYMKNNKIDSKYASVFYDEDERPYLLPLRLVFNNVMAIRGQYILACHFEDENGNPFALAALPDLNITLTDQNNREFKRTLKYNLEFGGYYLNTSSIDYGTYRLDGTLPSSGLVSNYVTMPGILYVADESGRTAPVLASPGLTKVYGQNDKLIITLKDGFGKPLSYCLIHVNLGGASRTVIADANGQVSLEVNLAPGTYTAHISFAGNGLYLDSAIEAKVVIKKAASKIISKKTLKLKKKSFSITLKDSFANPIRNAKVTIKIKKKTYVAKTNSKGKATFKLKLRRGKYKATVRYAGNAYFNAATRNVKIFVKK